MEDILRHRLELRKVSLAALIDSIGSQIDQDEASILVRRLKAQTDKLQCEINHYESTSSKLDIGVVDSALKVLLKAEELLTEIETLCDVASKTPQLQETLSSVAYNTPQTTAIKSSARLPKLELPKFHGDQLQWLEFWDRFKVNVDNQTIADVDKLSYLLSCLEGAAMEAVAGLSITEANYRIAVEALLTRYGSSDILVDAHYAALHRIPPAEYNAYSCRSTLNNINRHIRVLEELGEPGNGNHLRGVVLSKFPDKVVHENHLVGSQGNTTSTILENIHKIVRAMEMTSFCPARESVPAANATTEALHIRSEVPEKRFSKQPHQKQPYHKQPYHKQQHHKQPYHKQPHHDRKRKGEVPTETPPLKRFRLPCLFCNSNNHNSTSCKKVKDIEERKKMLLGRCLNCLNKDHKTETCTKKISCFGCNGGHLRMLCPKGYGKVSSCPTKESVCQMSNGCTYLQTAVASVRNPTSNHEKRGRFLLDSGSQRSYITERLAKSLKLDTDREETLLIYTFGASSPHTTSSPSTEIIVVTKRGILRKVQVNIVPHITERVPVAKMEIDNIDILADDATVGESVDVLIGNDFYCSFIKNGKIKLDTNLYLIDTDLGWILSGKHENEKEHSVLSVTTYCQCHIPSCPYFSEPDLPLRSIDLKFLWSLESIGITDSPRASRQEEAVVHFNETVSYENGRYMVRWPWIQYPPDLPSNFGLALGRLKSLVRRIKEESLEEYNTILNVQLDLGIIETFEPNRDKEHNHPIHYLPHHMVKQKGKAGRIVYDASAKTTGLKSLNECLYSGPSMLEDLTALLLKFRTKRVGITADVEKAFLQVGLQEEDRDVTRFLWLRDINQAPTDENLLFLRFTRVPFGIISSPFLLTATIRHHMNSSNQDLLKKVANECYVDNLVTGADTVQEAIHIYEETRTTFEDIGMNIRDWVSNDKGLMQVVPEDLRAAEDKDVKVLGLMWDLDKDNLKLKVTETHFQPERPVDTKRNVLRTLARIYDPCGFVCPLILPMKLLFQNICERKLKWDAKLPLDLKQLLETTLQRLRAVMDVELPRYIGIKTPIQSTRYEIHCFSDASKNAYAAVVYLLARSHQEIAVSFIMAKSHVSRAEERDELKIPRLELLGFLIGSRLLKYVETKLDLPIQKRYLWTDSLVVLGWIRSNKLLPPFVTNRVNEIKRAHPHTEMCYISTKSNPADIATRPDLWEEKKELWYGGPEFLRESESTWPEDRHYETHRTLFSFREVLAGEPEEDEVRESEVPQFELESPEVRLRGASECEESTSDEPEGGANTTAVVTARIKKLQQKYYPEESAGKKTHLGINLDLFQDVEGVLRCRGRMANTTWSYDRKYPILLPKDCDFTNNVIRQAHESNYHIGAAHTLNIIRERYWIPQGKAQVVKILRRCTQCVKHGGGPYKLPATPALPPERVNYSEPFTYTGVDYLGPLYVDAKVGKVKRWVALFTCLAVRAIHLEVVNDLTAEECLLALRRFAATRGIPKCMYSDNATCFKLTSEVMAKPYCIDKEIGWKFIPQLAPWHGGFYERLVALVKHCLKRTLEKHLLNDTKLLTVMKEVEAVVNSRPLTQVGTEIDHVLRPADFLSLGKCLTANSTSVEVPCTGTTQKIDLVNSWRKGIKIRDEFKRMFVGQYLGSLRERQRHSPKQPRIQTNRDPKLGDVVQIKSDSKNRDNWKMGKIVDLVKGADGECRVARVKADDSSIVTRSIGHLYPLEADSEDHPAAGQVMEVDLDHTRISNDEIPTSSLDRISALESEPVDHLPVEEILSHEDKTPVPVEPSPMEIDPYQEQVEPTDGQELVGGPVTHPDREVHGSPRITPFEGTKSRRGAAIRARAKILEWTRHLLALLH